ncbi:MAG: leucine-rich repeat domain-containing protein [Clostridia bacterium]|nr:leucine-rich repeat domain-containing protein [Clostridia bacterium]
MKKDRWIKVLTLLYSLGFALPFTACDGEHSTNEQTGYSVGLAYVINEEGYTVSHLGFCEDRDIVVPNEYKGKTVTAIGKGAFEKAKYVSSITLSSGLITIEERAFSECAGLTRIELPDGVTSIGDNVFAYCAGLTGVEFPNSVTSIGRMVFRGCASLTQIEYNGTIQQWESVEKGSTWKTSSLLEKVICADGEIKL